MIALLASAAILTPLVPLPITPADYPPGALRASESAAAIIDALYDPAGRLVSCSAGQSLGDAALVAQICRIAAKRRVKPATLADGTPSFGLFSDLVRLFVPDTQMGNRIARLVPQPHLVLEVARLPGGVGNRGELAIAVGVDGRITDCRMLPSKEKIAPLPGTICQNVRAIAMPVRSYAAGAPVAYVTSIRLHMKTAAQP